MLCGIRCRHSYKDAQEGVAFDTTWWMWRMNTEMTGKMKCRYGNLHDRRPALRTGRNKSRETAFFGGDGRAR